MRSWAIIPREFEPTKASLAWDCKRVAGQTCRVMLRKGDPPGNHVWGWDGTFSGPVNVRPSVHCQAEGCGLHFTLVDGKMIGHP